MAARKPRPSKTLKARPASTKPPTSPSTSNPRAKHRTSSLSSTLKSHLPARIADAGVRKRQSRSRRRAAKTRTLDLSALTDTLAATVDEAQAGTVEAAEKARGAKSHVPRVTQAMAQQRSLGSSKGMAKRREALGKVERERFRRNLGVLSVQTGQEGGGGDAGEGGGSAAKWAALRSHIEGSMAKQAV